MKQSLETRLKKSAAMRSALRIKRGGAPITCKRTARFDVRHRIWREAVLERDGHRCTMCGTGDRLIAHHVKDYRKHPALRYVVQNGLTVCRRCHPKCHTGWKHTTATKRKISAAVRAHENLVPSNL